MPSETSRANAPTDSVALTMWHGFLHVCTSQPYIMHCPPVPLWQCFVMCSSLSREARFSHGWLNLIKLFSKVICIIQIEMIRA
jgi:hypothetical protein